MKMWLTICFPLALFVFATAGFAATAPCDQWQLVNPLPTDQDLLGSAFGDDQIVIVGRGGTVLSSPDELSWQLQPSPTSADLHAVTWTGERFVAVGEDGTVLTSPDGGVWTAQTSGTDRTLFDVSGEGPSVVAVGTRGTILTSTDGISWTSHDSGNQASLRGIAWTGFGYIAVGTSNTALLSDLGTVWRAIDVGLEGSLTGIASSGSLTLVIDADGSTSVTTDGAEWNTGFSGSSPKAVEWIGDRFVDPSVPFYSFDGLSWTWARISTPGLELLTAVSDGDLAIAAGRNGVIAVSRDRGQHWKAVNTFIGLDLYGIASSGSAAVLAAGTDDAQHGALLASQDLINWDVVYQRGLEALYDVARGEDLFVAVGTINELWSGGGMIVRSRAGRRWEGAVAQTTGYGSWPWRWHAITWDGSRFVAAGSTGTIAISTDASNWHMVSLEDGESFSGVASDGVKIVAVGYAGTIAVCDDGNSLRLIDSGYYQHLNDVAWGGGVFVAVGNRGLVLSSIDGERWSERSSGTTRNLRGVTFSDEVFVAVGSSGAVLTSSDGIDWTALGNAGEGTLRDVLRSGSEHIAIGNGGFVARTACAEPDEPPSPRFAWRPTLPEAGVPVHFVDLSMGDPSSWQWSFGDDGDAAGPTVIHTFASAGVWPVTLTVTNDNGSASLSSEVNVRRFCGAPKQTVLSAPETVASDEPYQVTWAMAFGPEDWGDYYVQEARNPDFEDVDGLSTHPPTTSADYSHPWSDGGVFYYRVGAVNYCPDGSYRAPVSDSVAVSIEPDLAALGEHVSVIPAAAHGPGLKNTSWRSDVVIHNPQRWAAPAYLVLLPRVGQGEPVASSRLWVEPSQSLRLDDAVASLQNPGAGALLVASDRSLLVGSRTYNDHVDGTFGQFIAGTPLRDVVQPEDGARLIQLSRTDPFRTNLGFANPGPDDIEVNVNLHRADGTVLETTTHELPGLSSILDVDVMADLNGSELGGAYAVVTSAPPDAVCATLASVVDESTGDPVAQPPLKNGVNHRVVSRAGLLPETTQMGGRYLVDTGEIYVLLADRALLWSRDGLDWSIGRPFEGAWDRAEGLAVGAGQVLAVGRQFVYSSPNGIDWHRTSVPGLYFDGAAWNGSEWVGLSPWEDATIVVTSPDGIDWVDIGRVDYRIRHISWAIDRFIAVAEDGIVFSLDGRTWEHRIINDMDTRLSPGLAWNGVRMVALGYDRLFISEDLESWQTIPQGRKMRAVVWTGQRWVVAASASQWHGLSAFLVSNDGVAWEEIESPGSNTPPQATMWDGATVLAVDFDGVLSWLISDTSASVVPAAAHLGGYGGSSWRSDLALHNPGASEARCTVDLLKRNTENLQPASAEFTLEPQTSIDLPDVLDTEFGFNGAAALRIRAEDDGVLASSRTYDATADGTYGQMVPALRVTDAIWPFEIGRLIQLVHTPGMIHGYRTNIGTVSACTEPMEILIQLHLGSGELLGSHTVALGAFEAVQLNNVFASVSNEPVADGFAILSTSTPKCCFHAYASVVDNRSNDPILIPAEPWPVWAE